MVKVLSLAAGVALLVGVGAAKADEPITLTDGQMDTVTAAYGEYLGLLRFVGELNVAAADADAKAKYGDINIAVVDTKAETGVHSAEAESTSFALSADLKKHSKKGRKGKGRR